MPVPRMPLAAVVAVVALLIPWTLAQAASETSSEWRLLGNNSNMQHHSALTQVNDKNVGALGLAWVAEIPSADGLAGNPLVANGIIFQSGPGGHVYANDLKTGRSVWTFRPKSTYTRDMHIVAYWSQRYNRGLALLDDKVFVASGDCHVYALEQRTGKLVWDQLSCDPKQAYGITNAPRVGAGLVFVGNNCGDSGLTRGYVDAFEAATGRRKWRFYTVPGDPAKGFESDLYRKAAATWGTDWYAKSHGCGSVWEAMTYDAKLNLLYIGVGSPAPWSPAERAKDAGDELFSSSIVALKADSGEYVWHYKVVPNDGWDLHPTMPIMIADLPIGGQARRVVMEAPKDSFFYVLDAKTGAFISAGEFLPQNWALRRDPKTGRPVQNPAAQYWNHPGSKTVLSPGPLGNHNWQAMAFNPATGLVYIPAYQTPTLMQPDPQALVGGMSFDIYYGLRGDPKWKTSGELVAWDPVQQKARWKVTQAMPMNGGVMSTAGNLVFQGTADGHFNAYSADKGRLLWSFDAKESIVAAPSTVQVDGVQYILVAIGNAASANVGAYLAKITSKPSTRGPSRLLAFRLDGSASLPPFEVRPIPKPPLPPQPKQLAEIGHKRFEQNSCVDCHGLDAVTAGGTIKDLRFASAETHGQLAGIVIGGARVDKGMPAFPTLTMDDVKAIQAYVINRAWEDYDVEHGKLPPPTPIKH
jgi:PQQ-dependent dehydrogenase (methanol/ethanol family)